MRLSKRAEELNRFKISIDLNGKIEFGDDPKKGSKAINLDFSKNVNRLVAAAA